MTPVARGRKNGRQGRRLPIVVIREAASKGPIMRGYRIDPGADSSFKFGGVELMVWNTGERPIFVQPSGMVRNV